MPRDPHPGHHNARVLLVWPQSGQGTSRFATAKAAAGAWDGADLPTADSFPQWGQNSVRLMPSYSKRPEQCWQWAVAIIFLFFWVWCYGSSDLRFLARSNYEFKIGGQVFPRRVARLGSLHTTALVSLNGATLGRAFRMIHDDDDIATSIRDLIHTHKDSPDSLKELKAMFLKWAAAAEKLSSASLPPNETPSSLKSSKKQQKPRRWDFLN